jgi:hypothetical protein
LNGEPLLLMGGATDAGLRCGWRINDALCTGFGLAEDSSFFGDVAWGMNEGMVSPRLGGGVTQTLVECPDEKRADVDFGGVDVITSREAINDFEGENLGIDDGGTLCVLAGDSDL